MTQVDQLSNRLLAIPLVEYHMKEHLQPLNEAPRLLLSDSLCVLSNSTHLYLLRVLDLLRVGCLHARVNELCLLRSHGHVNLECLKQPTLLELIAHYRPLQSQLLS